MKVKNEQGENRLVDHTGATGVCNITLCFIFL